MNIEREEAEYWANDYLNKVDEFIVTFLQKEQYDAQNNMLLGFDKELFKYKRFIVAYERFKSTIR